jgi:hypothetical protein
MKMDSIVVPPMPSSAMLAYAGGFYLLRAIMIRIIAGLVEEICSHWSAAAICHPCLVV